MWRDGEIDAKKARGRTGALGQYRTCWPGMFHSQHRFTNMARSVFPSGGRSCSSLWYFIARPWLPCICPYPQCFCFGRGSDLGPTLGPSPIPFFPLIVTLFVELREGPGCWGHGSLLWPSTTVICLRRVFPIPKGLFSVCRTPVFM